jgi:hypothetical protein
MSAVALAVETEPLAMAIRMLLSDATVKPMPVFNEF